MYSVDNRDKVIRLQDVPQSDAGAPLPIVLSDEFRILLAYIVRDTPPDFSHYALIQFAFYSSYMFGGPNDEAFEGHPLASRGLTPYGAFQIENSSWIRQLERMNSVHPLHDPKWYDRYKHYVFTFHDSTFECVAHGFTVFEHHGSFNDLLAIMRDRLAADVLELKKTLPWL